LPALYKEAANLVGIDGPRDELIRWVMDEKKQLKGVTIVGCGGLGKTTLANEVYHRVKGQFDFHAFVSVSQRPDVARLLNSIRLKLGQQESSYPREVKDLTDNVREHLQYKRYLFSMPLTAWVITRSCIYYQFS
jgi:predicted ATPase